MATSSFSKKFVIKKAKAANSLVESLAKENKVEFTKRDLSTETAKGLALLKRSYSA